MSMVAIASMSGLVAEGVGVGVMSVKAVTGPIWLTSSAALSSSEGLTASEVVEDSLIGVICPINNVV